MRFEREEIRRAIERGDKETKTDKTTMAYMEAIVKLLHNIQQPLQTVELREEFSIKSTD